MKVQTFAELIKEERVRRKWSLNKLGELAGLTSAYIHRLESGERDNPSFTVVCQLVVALELDFSKVTQSFGFQHLFEPYQNEGDKDITIKSHHILNKELFQSVIDMISQYITHKEPHGILPDLISALELLRKQHQIKPSLVINE